MRYWYQKRSVIIIFNLCLSYENILLAGGNTLIPGFKERLEKELASLAPSTIKIKVDAPNNRKLTCFIGGSIMASLSSNQTKWITSSEYEEYGPTIVHRKLFDIWWYD